MKTHLLFVGFIAAALSSCASYPGARKTALALNGMIYDGDNRPVKEVNVYVNGKLHAVSDIHGHFTLAGVKTGGSYRIAARKDHYEEAALDIRYRDPSQVLYLSMSHRDQLLSRAEQGLREGDWALSSSLLARAEALDAEHPPTRYLEAALAFRRGDYEEALDILVKLEAAEPNAPYVCLFIADLFQYFTGDKDRAAAFLNKFLRLRYDPDVAARLRALDEAAGR
jgi:tetratricopeptide (TPR) repeat protein